MMEGILNWCTQMIIAILVLVMARFVEELVWLVVCMDIWIKMGEYMGV